MQGGLDDGPTPWPSDIAGAAISQNQCQRPKSFIGGVLPSSLIRDHQIVVVDGCPARTLRT